MQGHSSKSFKILHQDFPPLNTVVTNAWAKCRRDAEECGDLPKDTLCLSDFEASVGISILKFGSSAAHVGRKSAIEHKIFGRTETWREKDTATAKRCLT